MTLAHTDEHLHRLDAALGRRVRERRKALRLTLASLADSLGMTFQQVQKYESGANRISVSRLVHIAGALSCTVEDLIDGVEDGRARRPLRLDCAALVRQPHAEELLTAYLSLDEPTRVLVLNFLRELTRRHRLGRRASAKAAPAKPRRVAGRASSPHPGANRTVIAAVRNG
jgi:transcriptional regulator with XRE-family HTH domain